MPGDSDGEALPLWDSPSDGEADCGSPELCPSLGIGGGGLTGGSFWNTRIASSTATAAIRIISSQETSIEIQPARSLRPGHGSGHSRVVPCAVLPDQWSL